MTLIIPDLWAAGATIQSTNGTYVDPTDINLPLIEPPATRPSFDADVFEDKANPNSMSTIRRYRTLRKWVTFTARTYLQLNAAGDIATAPLWDALMHAAGFSGAAGTSEYTYTPTTTLSDGIGCSFIFLAGPSEKNKVVRVQDGVITRLTFAIPLGTDPAYIEFEGRGLLNSVATGISKSPSYTDSNLLALQKGEITNFSGGPAEPSHVELTIENTVTLLPNIATNEGIKIWELTGRAMSLTLKFFPSTSTEFTKEAGDYVGTNGTIHVATSTESSQPAFKITLPAAGGQLKSAPAEFTIAPRCMTVSYARSLYAKIHSTTLCSLIRLGRSSSLSIGIPFGYNFPANSTGYFLSSIPGI